MLVLRELAYGPRRFSELKADLQGISANVLTQRLTELEARGLVRKTRLPPPASVQVYEATDWGLEAVPVIASLGRWAARSPLPRSDSADEPRVVHDVASDPAFAELAQGLDARIGFPPRRRQLRRDGSRRPARCRARRGRGLRRDIHRHADRGRGGDPRRRAARNDPASRETWSWRSVSRRCSRCRPKSSEVEAGAPFP